MSTIVPEPALLTTDSELSPMLDEARAARRFALDTEFMRERTYRARLCLMQVATPEHIYLVEPLGSLDLKPLAELVGDLSIEVVVHAGRQDFELLHEMFGVVPANVLDVQLAAGFVGHGASLPYGRLVAEFAGVQLAKGESYTEWCRRPLTESQMRYAADDVRYLLSIADAIEGELDARERSEWAREEMRALEDPASYGTDATASWRRVGGRGTLSGRQLAILREVARWREETASQRDLPRGWVVKDPTLIEIARRGPSSVGALKSIRGFNAKEAERSGAAILAAIEAGKKSPPVETLPSPPRAAVARARMLSGLADAVVRARSEAEQVATELVATRGELEDLLVEVVSGRVDASHHRLLNGWRFKLAGEAVLALAEGRIAVKAVDRPPYIEEVEVRGVGGE